jgi:hypothetical protein
VALGVNRINELNVEGKAYPFLVRRGRAMKINGMTRTRHAQTRMAQRAIGEDDLEFIARWGTPVEGGYLFREKDFQSFERDLKKQRERARRLINKRLVVKDGRFVTVYHARRSNVRRLLRGAHD